MSCAYCESDGTERKWMNSTDNRTHFKLGKKCGSRTHKDLRMIVHWNSWKMRKRMDNDFNSAFKINFCPMCGKNLKEKCANEYNRNLRS